MTITTIIPALINNEELEHLLDETLSKIPPDSNLILITQNRKPILSNINYFKRVNWLHFNKPIGKWNAIKEGQNILRKSKFHNDRIVLLDADDPIQRDSLVAAYKFCRDMNEDWLIGCRQKIILHADDQLSERSRFYLEVFTNSLLLLQLVPEADLFRICAPDIQSGFYIFKSNVFKNIDLYGSVNYGGELMIFNKLITNKYRFCNFDIQITQARPSNYNISQILSDIFRLNFFMNISNEIIKRAIELTPVLYKRYFHREDYLLFKIEINSMLKGIGSV